MIESNIVSCALGSETIHLKLDLINSSIGLLLSNIPKIRKSSSHKEMYTKHDPCICQANILRKEMHAEDNIARSTRNLYKDLKLKQTRAEANTNILQKAKHILCSERYVQAQTKT